VIKLYIVDKPDFHECGITEKSHEKNINNNNCSVIVQTPFLLCYAGHGGVSSIKYG